MKFFIKNGNKIKGSALLTRVQILSKSKHVPSLIESGCYSYTRSNI